MSSSTTTQGISHSIIYMRGCSFKNKVDAQKSGGVRKSELVEIKNGKVIFKQKPLSFEKQSETMQGAR
jgi:chromatin assembly factor 1 subunit A